MCQASEQVNPEKYSLKYQSIKKEWSFRKVHKDIAKKQLFPIFYEFKKLIWSVSSVIN